MTIPHRGIEQVYPAEVDWRPRGSAGDRSGGPPIQLCAISGGRSAGQLNASDREWINDQSLSEATTYARDRFQQEQDGVVEEDEGRAGVYIEDADKTQD